MQSLRIIDTDIRQDAEGRFCLNDFHRAAGGARRHQPSNWLRTAQARELVSEIDAEGDPQNRGSVSVIKGGDSRETQGAFVARELVYAYAMWISPAFHLKVIRAFDSQQRVDRGLWQQMQALIAREVESKVRASFGSHLMLARKREIPDFEAQRALLDAAIQPSLLN